jgi:hypothetical protein
MRLKVERVLGSGWEAGHNAAGTQDDKPSNSSLSKSAYPITHFGVNYSAILLEEQLI